MSRQGVVPPEGHPEWGGWSSRRPVLGPAARVPVRQAEVGTTLYVGTAAGRIDRISMALLALGPVVLWTRSFGLLKPKHW